MNIYWCYERGDFGGLFIIAGTRGRAKMIFAREFDREYTEIRSIIQERGVNEVFEGIIEIGSPLLAKYNLEYTEEEAE